jgi:DNA-binding PadR family transcriptional regulator
MRDMGQSTPTLPLIILSLLDERPMHPYEMRQLMRYRALDRVVRVTAGSLYHTVERLQRGGWIEPLETGREGRRPERTVYAITESGRDRLQEILEHLLMEPLPTYSSFAAALSVMHHLPPEKVVTLLRRRSVALEAQLGALDRLMTSLLESGHLRSYLVEIEHERALTRAELAWVRELIEDLGAGRLPWPGQGGRQTPGPAPTAATETA